METTHAADSSSSSGENDEDNNDETVTYANRDDMNSSVPVPYRCWNNQAVQQQRQSVRAWRLLLPRHHRPNNNNLLPMGP